MSVPSARERVDLQTFKDKLKLVLNENAASYWDCLKKFAQAKLTKKELDQYAQSVLVTSENIALHNLFIKAILNNALCPTGPHTAVLPPPPPPSPQQQQQMLLEAEQQRAAYGVDGSTSKKQKLQQQFQQQQQPLLKKKKLLLIKGKPGSDPRLAAPHHDPISAASKAVLSSSIVHSPHLLALRDRMHVAAHEHGASHVTNEAVVCLSAALELHLSRLLQHVRLQRAATTTTIAAATDGSSAAAAAAMASTAGASTTDASAAPAAAAASGDPAAVVALEPLHQVVTVVDLLAAIDTHPHLLRETVSQNLERILASLQD